MSTFTHMEVIKYHFCKAIKREAPYSITKIIELPEADNYWNLNMGNLTLTGIQCCPFCAKKLD